MQLGTGDICVAELALYYAGAAVQLSSVKRLYTALHTDRAVAFVDWVAAGDTLWLVVKRLGPEADFVCIPGAFKKEFTPLTVLQI